MEFYPVLKIKKLKIIQPVIGISLTEDESGFISGLLEAVQVRFPPRINSCGSISFESLFSTTEDFVAFPPAPFFASTRWWGKSSMWLSKALSPGPHQVTFGAGSPRREKSFFGSSHSLAFFLQESNLIVNHFFKAREVILASN